MTEAERQRLAAHIAQARVARACQLITLGAGLVGSYWHGLPGALLGLAGYGFFSLARPAPDSDLDDITGRGR